MSWTDIFKSEQEKEFEEFLTNPKDIYAKFKEKFGLMEEEIASQKEEIKEYEKAQDEFYEEQNGYQLEIKEFKDEVSKLRIATDLKLEELEERASEEKSKWNEESTRRVELEIETKKAKLEVQYNHEVHIFVERQQDMQNDMIATIIRETLAGLNEKSKQ